MRSKQNLKYILPLLALLLLGSAPARAENAEEGEALYIGALKAISEKRHDDAKAMLATLIEKTPQHGGAWLELAMLQCELGNKAEADKLFQRMKQSLPLSPDELRKLELLQPKECNVRAPEKHVSVSMEFGYDTNVNQGASNPFFTLGSGTEQQQLQLLPEYQPKSDRYASLSANISRELARDGTTGFAQLRVRAYDALTSFNTMAAAAGLEHTWYADEYSVKGTGLISMLTLGGHLYQKQEIFQLRLGVPSPKGSPWHFGAITGLTVVQYPTLSNFDAHTVELRGLASYESEKFLLQGSLAYMADRAHSDRQGGNREGYYGNLNFKRQLYDRTELDLGWSHQIWQSAQIYSPTLINVARRQNIQTIRAALNWYINDRQTLQLEIRKIRNRENISILEYNGKTLQLSWQWQNF
ncbi:tetratricopeptide repeat protein [Undibacterium sp. TS12]|uniref:tetratricopeptide repeat protein n=1 Tax=Undibacterium sp. TS12 TaxID=2908202 RepID=UPI001F4C58C8|nr:tetratricopeptide repeat protein [Undibacterium sp. TS12]MCH8621927.1 tetratricopeptide repeat protein [Undibacterium sp. TS12]